MIQLPKCSKSGGASTSRAQQSQQGRTAGSQQDKESTISSVISVLIMGDGASSFDETAETVAARKGQDA